MQIGPKLSLYIALILFALTACQNSEVPSDLAQESEEERDDHADQVIVTEQQFAQMGMKLGTIDSLEFGEIVRTTGTIDVPPENRAVVSAIMGGFVEKTPYLIGDHVKKGQALVTLKNPLFVKMQQEYLETTQQLSYLKEEYERQQTLLEEKITSRKKFLKSESDYKTAVATQSGLRKNLQLLGINTSSLTPENIRSTAQLYSPINGKITDVKINQGSYVSAADPVMEIIDTDHIHVELSVFEKDAMRIAEGQKILFTTPESSEERYKAEVYLVGSLIDEHSRTVKVHGHLDHELEEDENINFIVGMFVEAEIALSSSAAPGVGEEAVVQIEDQPHLLLLEEMKNGTYHFEAKKVHIGRTNGKFVEILDDDIDLSTQCLLKGAFFAIEGGGGGHDH